MEREADDEAEEEPDLLAEAEGDVDAEGEIEAEVDFEAEDEAEEEFEADAEADEDITVKKVLPQVILIVFCPVGAELSISIFDLKAIFVYEVFDIAEIPEALSVNTAVCEAPETSTRVQYSVGEFRESPIKSSKSPVASKVFET